jgi:zinc finger SWIM domain-containing protein 3
LDYDAFGGVLVFDSMYHVNNYNLPFVLFIGVNHHRNIVVFGCSVLSDAWLLETFLLAMCQKHPRLLITNGDGAIDRAIYIVLLNAFHRLCSWHIENNMIKHIGKQFIS